MKIISDLSNPHKLTVQPSAMDAKLRSNNKKFSRGFFRTRDAIHGVYSLPDGTTGHLIIPWKLIQAIFEKADPNFISPAKAAPTLKKTAP